MNISLDSVNGGRENSGSARKEGNYSIGEFDHDERVVTRPD
jgi:hypothetical protein